ncbi:MAG: glutamate--tRNA ligase [Nanoarchaeota archaeon]|nr:MAG: glutamate--tRNA ligase [Nanoarchaeota archaeon]
MDVELLIRKHALANALKYDGKASQGAVIGKILGEAPELKNEMKSLGRHISQTINEVNSISQEDQRKELEKIAPELLEKKVHVERGLPELHNAQMGKVVLRLAPYPSGPLHIGNARPAVLNDEYAKKYEGRMLLVIDDTIGSEEKQIAPEAYDLIPQGMAWLGVKWHGNIIYKSDRLNYYYDAAGKLIEKGAAYACSCNSMDLRKNREMAKECIHRNQPVSETKNMWQKMLDGFFKEGEVVLRIKTGMQHPNPAFRDRVLFRISERPHPKVGKKYRVWPLLEFSWAIDDNLLGITHIIRGKDLMIESDMERFIWELFGWPNKEIIHLGIVQLEGVKISKSKSAKEVSSGDYEGWDDPRTWSLQSLERRGIMPQALRQFVLSFGCNANEITAPVDNLYTENRRLIEKEAPRYFFVHNPKEIRIDKAPHITSRLRKHPNNPEMGFRELSSNGIFYVTHEDYKSLGDGKVIRLMDCLNFIKNGYQSTYHSLTIEEYKKSGSRIIHWLPVSPDLKSVKVFMTDGTYLQGFGEPALKELKIGTIMQFERFGFCRYDHDEGGTMVFWFTHK